MRFILLVYLRHLCHTQYRATEGDKIYATASQCTSVFGGVFCTYRDPFSAGLCAYRRIVCISQDTVYFARSCAWRVFRCKRKYL